MTTVAITGAAGYIGQRLLHHLVQEPNIEHIVALDIRPPAFEHPKITFVRHDVTHPMSELFVQHGVAMAVHLAFVVAPLLREQTPLPADRAYPRRRVPRPHWCRGCEA